MKIGLMLALVLAPLAAQAAEPGAETRTWLSLQRAGTAASPEARPVPGEVAEQVYLRYLKSFSHPIPERFEVESFSTESSGSGS